MADARREQLSRLDEDAGKLADPVPGVPEPDVRSLPPVRSAQLGQGAPYTPGADPYAVRSCAATVTAVAVAQWAWLLWLLPELLAVAALKAAELRESESQLGLREAQPADVPVAQLAELSRQSQVAVPMAEQER